MKKAVPIVLVMLSFMLFLVASVHATDYVELQATGDDMAPAIRTGDTVRVKICTDGSLIKAGSATSDNPGDIIVYCAGVIVPYPGGMWACGRVISKRFEDGEWYLKTQLDSATEPDRWEVPEHALLGFVVEVVHASQSSSSDVSKAGAQGNAGSYVFDLLVGIGIGVALGFGAKEALSGRAHAQPFFSGSFRENPSRRTC